MDALNFIYQQIKDEINNILILEKKEELFSYFDNTQLTQLNDNYATIATSYLGKIILDKDDIKEIINSAIKKVLKKDILCKIVTTTNDDYANDINNELIEKELNDNLLPEFTFDNFVVGPSNKQARMAAHACAVSPGQSFNPLIIYGNSGLGKTHLLNAIGNYVKAHDKEKKVLCISSMNFVNEVVKAINNNTIEEYKSQLNSVDILLVDDIQFLSGKRKSEEIFFNIYYELFNNRKQIVLTSDRPPAEIKDIENRLKTRLSQGLSVTISSLEYETAYQILKLKLKMHGIEDGCIDDDVISFMATNFSSDVRNLEGAINRLLFYSINLFETKKIDLSLALEAFKDQDFTTGRGKDLLNVDIIVKAVADYYNLTEKQIKSKSRTKNISTARHIAMYLSRKILDISYDKIGEEFGGKDHTTVINAYEKIENLVKTNEIYKKIITDIEKTLSK